MNTDFIKDMNKQTKNENHIEGICRAFVSGEHLYDGSNPYGKPQPITFNEETFVPSVWEIKEAMKFFKEKGWFGIYDADVGYYAVYKEEPTLGDYQRRFTHFLFRPEYANH